MNPHDFMTLHAAKAVEYGIAVAYLLLFIPFWRFVTARPKAAAVHAHAGSVVPALKRLFALPEALFYHPGHAWLRVERDDTVTVGFDDFAGKLVGAPSAFALPRVGATLRQGETAWAFQADGKSIDMLSPVDGTVVAVNQHAQRAPEDAHKDPYGAGWLLKVRSPRLAANLKQLLSGELAAHWMDRLADDLQGGMVPALGAVYQDGGAVVDGLAKVLDSEAWDVVARRYLLTLDAAPTENGGAHA